MLTDEPAKVIDLTPSSYQRKIIGPAMHQRQRLLRLFVEAEDPGLLKLAERIADCARTPMIAADSNGRLRCLEMRCKSRMCPICSRRRTATVTHRVAEAVRRMNSPRLITLTLRSSDAPLREQLLRIRRCFAELRRTASWKQHVIGGTYTLEISYNAKRKQWHPHLHVIADGTFFSQSLLSANWLRATGDSNVVDIRKVNSAKEAAAYIAGYVSKTSSPVRFPDEVVAEWAIETRGLRFVQQFGSLHGVKLDPGDKPQKLPTDLHPIGGVDKLSRAADRHDEEARTLLAYCISIRHRRPSLSDASNPRPAQPGEQTIAERLRAWFSANETTHHDDIDPVHHPSRQCGVHHRPERLWQDEPAAPRH